MSSVLQRTPLELDWECLSHYLGRWEGGFEAVSDGHLYSINTLDGTVLFDGCPPSRLPKAVLKHSAYIRSFGDNNFEVSGSSAL